MEQYLDFRQPHDDVDHVLRCREIVADVEAILQHVNEHGVTNERRLCKLSAVVANQYSGKKGAGLMNGLLQEGLWSDMFFASSKNFSATATRIVPDADYYFREYPISHKTIGWTGTGDLALAWSKNPPAGLQRTVFRASIGIALTRNPSPTETCSRHRWID